MEHLCKTCRDVFSGNRVEASLEEQRIFEAPFAYIYHRDAKVLFSQAKRGCPICQLLVENIGLDVPRFADQPHTLYTLVRKRDEGYLFTCRVRLESHVLIRIELHILPAAFETWLYQKELQDELENGIDTGPSIWSPKSVLRVREDWMHLCRANHDHCNRSTRPMNWAPSRLVDLSGPYPRLRTRAQVPDTVEYLTLSHCWGKTNILRLMKHTLVDFQREIPMSELTRTFRDAFRITEDLGFHYIWIDSLCIIQDSDEDWKVESAAMGDIYAHGELNIAAAAAEDGRAGCIIDRDQRKLAPLHIDIPKRPLHKTLKAGFSDFKTAGAVATIKPGRYCCVDSQLWQRDIVRSPLGRRGWVCQERLLAKRILYFGQRQLFFECAMWQYCEQYPVLLPGQLGVGASRIKARSPAALNLIIDRLPRELQQDTRARDRAALTSWCEMIHAYSGLDLTYGTDKLVAASGVARYVKEKIESQYLAGLWRRDLLEQLLWYNPRQVALLRPEQYQAPTWSWASVKGQVTCDAQYALEPVTEWPKKHPSYLRSVLAEVVDAHVTLNDDRYPFGKVKDGHLLISGRLIKVNVQRREPSDYGAVSWATAVDKSKDFTIEWFRDAVNDWTPGTTDSTFVLPLLAYLKDTRTEKPNTVFDNSGLSQVLSGLILGSVGMDCGPLRRLGFFELRPKRVSVVQTSSRTAKVVREHSAWDVIVSAHDRDNLPHDVCSFYEEALYNGKMEKVVRII